MDHRHGDDRETRPSAGLGPRGRAARAGLVAVVAYFFWTGHRAHVIQFLPWAFLAPWPLMHLFLHGDHDHGGYRSDRPRDGTGESTR